MTALSSLILALSLALILFVLYLMVRWARTRSAGAISFGALLTLFAPDPTLESQIRLVEEAKREEHEEDEEGEPH